MSWPIDLHPDWLNEQIWVRAEGIECRWDLCPCGGDMLDIEGRRDGAGWIATTPADIARALAEHRGSA